MTNIKIITIGDSGVGKTNIINKYTTGNFSRDISPTIGVEFFTKKLKINDKDITAQIWDTAGQEKYRSITKSIYHGAKAIVAVYDITNSNSFNNMEYWIKEAKNYIPENTPICLVGNKLDLDNIRDVPENQADNFAKVNKLLFFETSAVNNTNISLVFDYLIKQVIENNSDMQNMNQKPKPKINIIALQTKENKTENKAENKAENKTENKSKCKCN